MVTLRRRPSTRTRQPTQSIYEDAKKSLESSSSPRSTKSSSTKSSTPGKGKSVQQAKKKALKEAEQASAASDDDEPMQDDEEDEELQKQQQEEEDVEMQEEEEEEQESTSDDDEESDDDDEDHEERPARGRKQPAKANKRASPKTRTVTPPPGKKQKKTSKNANKARAPTRRAVQAALAGVAKSVLHREETPDTSLFAALVHLLQADKGQTKKRARGGAKARGNGDDDVEDNNNDDANSRSARLDALARQVLQDHDSDPNQAQVRLYNLLFRSVGTTYESLLQSDDIDLDVASDEDWEDIVTRVTEGMQETQPEHVLLSADPQGADHGGASGNSKKKRVAVAPLEYRKAYSDFWYQLGACALVKTTTNKQQAKGGGKAATSSDIGSSRFQIEMSRDILARMIEVSGVGQPDIRAAASLAAYQFTQAMLDHSANLLTKLQTFTRQLNAMRTKSGRKFETLQNQIDACNRTLKELEEIVVHSVMNSVFTKRYKDSNKFIRSESLKAASRFMLSRPDLLLKGTYLKYFGWMLSDKEALVRQSALEGFLAPFTAKLPSAIDKKSMTAVIDNFLKRIVDLVNDVDYNVQELAMELLLKLLAQNYLDKLDDDAVWDQINLRSLAVDTTPRVRRDALCFVMEQLDAFDSGVTNSESKIVERIDGIAKWVAHALADSDIPVENAKFELVDYVVHSLRSMPDHKPLVSNWTALLRALESDDAPAQQTEDDRRLAAVKQRVVLRMLVCAAELEVSATADGSFMADDVDPDLAAVHSNSQRALDPNKPKGKVKESSHEKLTNALLSALPELLVTFNTEISVLRDLTRMPRYFLPTVFSMPGRKQDFTRVISRLSDVFLESTDRTVLDNCGLVLASMAQQNHARTGEALLQLKKTACSLRDRLLKLLNEKAKLSSKKSDSAGNEMDDDDDEDEETMAAPRDVEHSICLCLQRLVVLAKRYDIAELLVDDASEEQSDDKDEEMTTLCTAIANHLARELQVRKVIFPEGEDDEDCEDEVQIPEIWVAGDSKLHAYVSETVKEGFSLLLTVTAWRLDHEIELVEKDEAGTTTGDMTTHVVLQMRDRLLKLIHYCFEQHIEPVDEEDEDIYSPEHVAFATTVQEHACEIAGDLRVLFPKEWGDAKSPFLRACALVENDEHLLGGYARFISFMEPKLRENERNDDPSLSRQLLFPLARGLSANWKLGHRREAGSALSHIIGSGQEAKEIVTNMARVMKKIDPIRFLESHMACLQQNFELWLDTEPEELSDRPSEEELAAFEQAENAHTKKFQTLEHLAGRLSASLGVGKLNKGLAPALLGFVGEGIRFSFSTGGADDDAAESLGARLPFLRIIAKYLTWIRKEKAHVAALRKQFNEKESALRNHPDWKELDEYDLKTLDTFRKDGGLGNFPQGAGKKAVVPPDDDTHEEEEEPQRRRLSGESVGDDDDDDSLAEEPPKRRPRMSVASSVSSIRSKLTLSPLHEEGDDDGDSPPKSQKTDARSTRSFLSHSTMQTQTTRTTIHEGNEKEEESSKDDE